MSPTSARTAIRCRAITAPICSISATACGIPTVRSARYPRSFRCCRRGWLGFLDYTEEEKQMFKPVLQRLVRTHPVHGRKSLYLSSHAGAIVGMSVPEARLLLRDLNEHATQREFVYVHKWTLHDLVMWDNRQTMHRVRRYDQSQPRDMRRATVAGTQPTVAQQAAE